MNAPAPDQTRDENCLFCKIVAGEIPAQIVHTSDHSVAFRDVNPQAPTHVLVVPKGHYPNAGAIAQQAPSMAADLITTARDVAAQEGLDNGYRLVFNTGEDAGQTVFHVHLHLLGGRPLEWPPG
ncbi:histidine triad nucleotide-binding protein [Nocardioides sp.]|uniref:histidine triad nucleotide-binding protein n=1 Tax=Nocardioides sp. TaxID=35761 RepID=UPI002C5BF7D7|nr:histidine triad nucleotide-binding protein [Nocardioides sp.]HSX67450.1 histidine triad nucleotide-binding protein [Nocardioides sp.]